jgi:gliding motility-associated-like protein
LPGTLNNSGEVKVRSEKNGCPGDTLTFTLLVKPIPSLVLTTDTLACLGRTVTARATTGGNAEIVWSNNVTGAQSQLPVGIHWVESRLNGCSTRDSFRIRNSGPEAAFVTNPAEPVRVYQTTRFEDRSKPGRTPITGWNWDLGFSQIRNEVSPSYVYPETGEVEVVLVVTDQAGCTDTVTRSFIIEKPAGWFIPTLFTPGRDTKNDTFIIQDLETYPGTSLKIVNRWGEEVFESGDYRNDWKAEGLREGVYFYTVVRGLDRRVFSGYVTLVPEK